MTWAAQEIVWVHRVLNEVGLGQEDFVCLRSDNQGAMGWATGQNARPLVQSILMCASTSFEIW